MANMPGMRMGPEHHMDSAGMHAMSGPLGIPMTRMGSGTSWLPDSSPMHAFHAAADGWGFMVHGVAFAEYDRQGSARGGSQFGSVNWLMGMADHALGDGRVSFRGMFSAEPWTIGARGYPELLQSGESLDGQPLHDTQHPHNLFMELAAIYETPITHGVAAQLYVAPVGEPALGPVAFPHRPSAANDPFAPLGHHWQDATHITFGVLSAGLFTSAVKLEGSIFNGREPDQNRADIEYDNHAPTLDSYSGRLFVDPAGGTVSLSGWYGYLKSPEELEPTVSQHRLGASILTQFTSAWSGAVIWGANLYSNDPRLSNSALIETNLAIGADNNVFGRLEYVNKSPDDLDVDLPGPARFNIGAISAGYVREIGPFTKYGSAGVGFQLSLDLIPASLEPYYRTRTPAGFGIFLRLRPNLMQDMHM
jgi:hypothetical protein